MLLQVIQWNSLVYSNERRLGYGTKYGGRSDDAENGANGGCCAENRFGNGNTKELQAVKKKEVEKGTDMGE